MTSDSWLRAQILERICLTVLVELNVADIIAITAASEKAPVVFAPIENVSLPLAPFFKNNN
jgi:hypothetical protein